MKQAALVLDHLMSSKPTPNVIENTDLVQCDIDDVQDGIYL